MYRTKDIRKTVRMLFQEERKSHIELIIMSSPGDFTVYETKDCQLRLEEEYSSAFNYYVQELKEEWSYSPLIYEGVKAKRELLSINLNNPSIECAIWDFKNEIFIISFDGSYYGHNPVIKLDPSISAILIRKNF